MGTNKIKKSRARLPISTTKILILFEFYLLNKKFYVFSDIIVAQKMHASRNIASLINSIMSLQLNLWFWAGITDK